MNYIIFIFGPFLRCHKTSKLRGSEYTTPCLWFIAQVEFSCTNLTIYVTTRHRVYLKYPYRPLHLPCSWDSKLVSQSLHFRDCRWFSGILRYHCKLKSNVPLWILRQESLYVRRGVFTFCSIRLFRLSLNFWNTFSVR